MRFILGSTSPRRKEILQFFNLPFLQMGSEFDETTVPFTGDPKQYTSFLSSKKALTLAVRFPEDLILTADTIVYFKNRVLNKPQDPQEAFEMLRALSDNWHQVFTSMSLYYKKNVYTDVNQTNVLFNPLSDEQIALYHRHDPCLDKAGGYAIQGSGGILISKIDGCYYNVMGLPINLMRQLLLHAGIDLWHHLK